MRTGSYEMASTSFALKLLNNPQALERAGRAISVAPSKASRDSTDAFDPDSPRTPREGSSGPWQIDVPMSPEGHLRLRFRWIEESASSAAERQAAAADEAHFKKDTSSARVGISVHLVSAKGLMAADRNGLSDPYVILRLGNSRRRSKVVPMNLNPVWEEEFGFTCLQSQFESSVISVDVWDKDTFSLDDHLGRTELPLSKVSPERLDR